MLFRGLKSSGFNIEDTDVTDLERLEKLFSLTMIAFLWCYKIGDYQDENIKKIEKKIWQKSCKRIQIQIGPSVKISFDRLQQPRIQPFLSFCHVLKKNAFKTLSQV